MCKYLKKKISLIMCMVLVFAMSVNAWAAADTQPQQQQVPAAKYQITYYLNGGVNDAANPATYDGTVKVKLGKPQKQGYKFAGWYNSANFDSKVGSIKPGSIGDLRLYAKWKPVNYKVKYVIKTCGVKKVKNDKANVKKYNLDGGEIKLLNPYTKNNDTFSGWYEDKEFTSKVTTLNGCKAYGGKITLYARWNAGGGGENTLSGNSIDLMVQQALDITNAERAKKNLPPYVLDDKLCKAAQIRVAELPIKFDHTRPDGRSGLSAITEDAGFVGTLFGENIAKGTPTAKDAMDAWMASDKGHRDAILSNGYNCIGIAVYKSGDTVYWVQCFGKTLE